MEKWDLLDNKRKLTGRYIYRGEIIPKGFYHQIVHLAIFNEKGQMLIQKRSDKKSKWKNLWDISCAGAVRKGEDSQSAIRRELFEELSIDYDFSKEKVIFTLTYEKGFDDFYSIKIKNLDLDKLSIEKDEVEEISWANFLQIKEKLENNDFIPYNLEVISLLFQLKDGKSYIKNT